MAPVIIAIIGLGTTGIAGAVILYAVAKKFYVNEDPRMGHTAVQAPQPVHNSESITGRPVSGSMCMAFHRHEATQSPCHNRQRLPAHAKGDGSTRSDTTSTKISRHVTYIS